MRILLVSSDPAVRQQMAVVAGSVRGRLAPGEQVELFAAADGRQGIRSAWRRTVDVVVADEITSHAGAFALAKELKGAEPAFPGRIVILLERPQDEWLARWSGADAWFVKPVDPFALAEAVAGVGVPRAEAVSGPAGESR